MYPCLCPCLVDLAGQCIALAVQGCGAVLAGSDSDLVAEVLVESLQEVDLCNFRALEDQHESRIAQGEACSIVLAEGCGRSCGAEEQWKH